MSGYNVEKEIEHLVHEMKRSTYDDNKCLKIIILLKIIITVGGSSGTCTFGQLFHDDKIQNLLESLVGTMKGMSSFNSKTNIL